MISLPARSTKCTVPLCVPITVKRSCAHKHAAESRRSRSPTSAVRRAYLSSGSCGTAAADDAAADAADVVDDMDGE